MAGLTPEELIEQAAQAELAGHTRMAELLREEAARSPQQPPVETPSVSLGGPPSEAAPSPPPGLSILPEPEPIRRVRPGGATSVVSPPLEPPVSEGPPEDVPMAVWLHLQNTLAPRGRDRDLDALQSDLEEVLGQTERDLVRFYNLEKGMQLGDAQRRAEVEIEEIRSVAVDPGGAVTTTGEDNWIQRLGRTIGLPWLGDIPLVTAHLRESRIERAPKRDPEDPSKTILVDEYTDPETGDKRPPSTGEEWIESFTRQTLLDPAEAAKIDASRVAARKRALQAQAASIPDEETRAAVEQQLAKSQDPWLDVDILTTRDPKSGRVLETGTAAFTRSAFAVASTLLNEAIFDYIPYLWEQDPHTGKPVDPEDPAYRAHVFVREVLESAGMSEEDIEQATKGVAGTGPAGLLPIPFQPTQREQPHAMDPTGRRAANAGGSFAQKAAHSMAKGRFLGDELMSIVGLREGSPAYEFEMNPGFGELSEDRQVAEYSGTTAPFYLGMLGEMFYGGGPLSIMKHGVRVPAQAVMRAPHLAQKLGLRTIGVAASDPVLSKYLTEIVAALDNIEKGAKAIARPAYVAAHPLKAAERSKVIQIAQDLAEGRMTANSVMDILNESSDVRRVTGEVMGGEVIGPYLMEARRIAGGPGKTTVGDLRDAVGDVKSARFILDRAGLLNAADNHVITAAEASRLSGEFNTWATSAYKGKALGVLTDETLTTPQMKAARILTMVEEGGIDPARVANIRNIQDVAKLPATHPVGSANTALRIAVDSVFDSIPDAAPAVRAGRTVYQAGHHLGSDLVRIAQGGKDVALDGPLGRIAHRRMGDVPITRAVIADRADEVYAATRGALGRAVEATLEDAIPDNFQFVTNSLMAPRKALTEEVMADVRRGMDEIEVTRHAGGKIDGRETVDFVYDDPTKAVRYITQAFGEGNINRSPALTRIVERVKSSEKITAAEHSLVQDQLLTREFERVLGRHAKEAVYGTPKGQAEVARIPGVSTGAGGAPEDFVPRRTLGILKSQTVRAFEEGIARPLGSAIRRAGKKFGKEFEETVQNFPSQTPYAVDRALSRLKSEGAAISDNLAKEIRDTALRAVKAGKTHEEAFNSVLQSKLDKVIADVTGDIDQEVQRLARELGMPENEAYYFIAYQMGAGSPLPGIGDLKTVGKPIPPGSKALAHDRAALQVKDEAWNRLFEEFFDLDVYHKIVAPVINRFIREPQFVQQAHISAPDMLKDITLANIRGVLALMRKKNPRLMKRGLSRGIPGIEKDAIFDLTLGFMMDADKGLLVRRIVREMRDLHPELFSDLVATSRSADRGRQYVEASMPGIIRRGALETLSRMSVPKNAPQRSQKVTQAMAAVRASPEYAAIAKRATDAAGQYKTLGKRYVYEQTGDHVKELDRLTSRLIENMNPETREKLVNQAVSQMLTRGTATLDIDELLGRRTSPALNLQVFRKDVMMAELRSMTRSMDTEMLRALDANRVRTSQLKHLKQALGSGADMPDPNALAYLKRISPGVYRKLLLDAFKQSEADAALYDAVVSARASGFSDGEITYDLYNGMVGRMFRSTIEPAIDDVVSGMRAMGFGPGSTDQAMGDMTMLVRGIDPNSADFAYMGQDFVDVAGKLRQAADSGKLTKNIDALRRRDTLAKAQGRAEQRSDEMSAYAGALVKDFLLLTRRTAASGLLAGGGFFPVPVPIPNMRYMGMNVITAPLIATTTVGAANAVRMLSGPGKSSQLREVKRQLNSILGRPLLNTAPTGPPEEVIFTTKAGRKWTRAEFEEAVARNNISVTRGSIEFSDAFVTDVMRDARLLADGMPASKLRSFLRQLDPTRTNIFQFVANATDRVFRENMFASALKQGMPEEMAAEMGRAVVLDYGRVPENIKTGLNRYVLFMAFRTANTVETVEAIARDPALFSAVLRTQRNLQNSNDMMVLGPDYTKSRLVIDPKQYLFDGVAGAVVMGPSIPALEAYGDLMDSAVWFGQLWAENNRWFKRAAETVADENLVPWMSWGIEAALDLEKSPVDVGYKVPDKWMAFAANRDPRFFEWITGEDNIFNIGKVPDKYRTPGRPTAMGEEWRFESWEGMQAFKLTMLALQYTAFKRTTEEYTAIGMTYGPQDFVDPKYRNLVIPLSFGSGAATPIRMKSPSEIVARSLFEQARRAQDLAKKTKGTRGAED